MSVQALMYHDVMPSRGDRGGFEGEGPDVYAVTDDQFRAHLDAIDGAVGRAPVAADALVAGSAPSGSWLITFDDGGSSAAVAGAELAQRGWCGHFFIVSGLVGRPGFLSWDEIRTLVDQGHVIGSHSRTHPQRISSCSPEELRDEWSGSVTELSERLGRPITTGSVPGGYYSEQVGEAAVEAGLTSLFTSQPVRSTRSVDGCLLIGRYAVRGGTTAAEAASVAAGSPLPWARQRAAWGARSVAKTVGGRHYERLRSTLLSRR